MTVSDIFCALDSEFKDVDASEETKQSTHIIELN